MEKTIEEKNKSLALEAFDAAFNKRDKAAYERYWSPDYIQHSAHISPGRDGLKELIASAPANMRYEPGLAIAKGDFVMIHGRFTNIGQPKAWVVVDILRIENGLLAEHWDVIQNEATAAESRSGKPMFGDQFSEV
ncbi:nuclear transport factor 2 family protein [Mucilaginibacter sp. KACC 22773]|uniref:nuclear transport factor 2 family protein n=1 Tax=Mucilaginibacter sp. KACC 22773 TaxID=3025671 RepID=UPI00236531D8|nr:nuclear transport factor 2 family protein [Mucilaginibacter sp. KACC 22773]WDF79009.1 nuclear transport factor 2 family protein [Mucilaginibacter sp. KACC 22773]